MEVDMLVIVSTVNISFTSKPSSKYNAVEQLEVCYDNIKSADYNIAYNHTTTLKIGINNRTSEVSWLY